MHFGPQCNFSIVVVSNINTVRDEGRPPQYLIPLWHWFHRIKLHTSTQEKKKESKITLQCGWENCIYISYLAVQTVCQESTYNQQLISR